MPDGREYEGDVSVRKACRDELEVPGENELFLVPGRQADLDSAGLLGLSLAGPRPAEAGSEVLEEPPLDGGFQPGETSHLTRALCEPRSELV
jgi:hypothetical protein